MPFSTCVPAVVGSQSQVEQVVLVHLDTEFGIELLKKEKTVSFGLSWRNITKSQTFSNWSRSLISVKLQNQYTFRELRIESLKLAAKEVEQVVLVHLDTEFGIELLNKLVKISITQRLKL